MTAQTVIDMAFRRIGQTRPGYTTSPELYADALLEWQMFVDELNAERDTSFSKPDYVYPVATAGYLGNNRSYQIGPTATDFVGPRPDRITGANWIYPSGSNSVRIRLSVIEQWQWALIPVLDIPAINVTQSIYYDPQFPNGVLNCWPPVQPGSGSFELFTWGVLLAPTLLNSPVDAPPGYWSLFRFMLADRLVPLATRHNIITDQKDIARLRIQAYNAKTRIERVNAPSPKLGNNFHSQGARGNSGFDYYTGEPY